ncbi:4-hydroxybenzoyl-CoA thioesterase [Mameliella alba]|nr:MULTISPECIES: acyl-CoA thioesterase [Mameliella]OWV40791.1 4-hydroxybenzoyl-CoA thioesterase [Mameliella alba]OWV52193.1 4-hydroxybenzoyl-CoA thioesterase [Mameliella alba]OWV53333.1 4-hydroxybenzoyl-CoA thioesterase [Mameliella alba]
MMRATNPVQVVFGDCDPAAIVFYPNIFRWMDGAFHHMLRPLGGHQYICDALGIVGIGLVEVGARFRSPIRDGDTLLVEGHVSEWARRTLTLSYTGRVGDNLAFEGTEVRCLFTRGENGIVAGDTTDFREMLSRHYGG